MSWYAQNPTRRALQVTGDVLLLVWVWGWMSLARLTHDGVVALAVPGEKLDGAATGLAGQLRGAGDAVASIPLVGDDIRSPFDGAGEAADRIAAAGASQADGVTQLAVWLALAVALIPIALLVALYVPRRVRFARETGAAVRLLAASPDLRLLALRALTRQPLHRLVRVAGEPVAGYEAGDPHVLRLLADLELGDAGLLTDRERADRSAA